MAVPSNTLIGRTRGSIGNVTFSTWKGVNVMKSKATSVGNPQTNSQMVQRWQFKNCSQFFAANVVNCTPFLSRAAVRMTIANAFMKRNIKVFEDQNEFPYPRSGYINDLKLSSGNLGEIGMKTISISSATNNYTLDINNVSVRTNVIQDNVQVVAVWYQEGDLKFVFENLSGNANTQTWSGKIPDGMAADLVHLFLILQSSDNATDVSETFNVPITLTA